MQTLGTTVSFQHEENGEQEVFFSLPTIVIITATATLILGGLVSLHGRCYNNIFFVCE